MSWSPFAVIHLTLAASWLGAMGYSLVVVQPKATRFFDDDRRREEFLTVLAHGNRWRVVGLLAALLGTGAAVAVLAPGAVAAGYGAVLGCQLAAGVIFAHVSWRHWPARVFALPAELPGYQRRLRRLAWAMLALVGAGFVIAASVSVAAGR